MTFQTLYQQLQAELDDDESESLVVIKQFINDACKKIWQAHPWSFKESHFTLSTVSGTQDYTHTSLTTLEKITRIGYKGSGQTGFTPLTEISLDEFLARNLTPATTGQPYAYCYYQSKIKFLPAPDYSGTDNLEIWGDLTCTDLSADADVVPIPDKYAAVIKRYVKAAFWDFDDDVRADGEFNKFTLIDLPAMKADDANPNETPRRRLFG